MEKAQNIEHYHFNMNALSACDECILVIPSSILIRSSLDIGDELVAEPKGKGLFIRKKRASELKGDRS